MGLRIRRVVAVLFAVGCLLALGLPNAPSARADVGATISGAVTGASGDPIAGAVVRLCRYYPASWFNPSASVDSCYDGTAISDGQGSFRIAADFLMSGEYTLTVSKSGYWSVWMDGSILQDPDAYGNPPPTGASAHFAFTGASVELPDPVALPDQHVLAGRVVDARGDAAAGLRVALFPDAEHLADGDLLTSALTDVAGAFSVAVPVSASNAELVLGVTDPDAVFAQYTMPITLAQEDRTLGDPIRLPEVGSVVRGRVVDADGNPMAAVSVSSLKYDDEESMWLHFHTVQSDSNGYYTVKVRPGQRFSLSYSADGYLTAYYPDRWAEPASADGPGTFQAAAVGVPNADLDTVAMQAGFAVTVPVRWAGQTRALQGAGVYAYPAGHNEGDPAITEQGTSNGESELKLPAGNFDIVIKGKFMSPELETVTLTNVRIDRDTTLATVELRTVGNTVTGAVVAGDLALAGARVSVYYWDHEWEDSTLQAGDAQTTDSDGRFSLVVRDADPFTVRVSKNGYETVWLGGGSLHPETATGDNSRVSQPDLDLGVLALTASDLTIGKVAGQDLSYCTANQLWGDAWTSMSYAYGVRLPFAAKFFQNSYRTANVSSDGRITLGDAYDDTSRNLADISVPVIAPFWSATDLSSPDSGPVTYGSSPDGDTFCVTWNRMTRRPGMSDGWDTFQMLLTDRSSVAGRTDGDFDIAFNYDGLQWDSSGYSSDGSALVGYSAGLGQPGTFLSMDGSGVPGTFTDQGTWPLVTHSLNSEQPGRYVFEIRNGDIQLAVGTITGKLVRASDGQPIQGSVSACRLSAGYGWCPWVKTDADGSYTLQGMAVGDYTVSFNADGMATTTSAGAAVKAGEVTDMGTLRLRATASIPSGTSLTHRDMVNGVPVVFDGDELSLAVPNPCSSGQAATGTWEVIDAGGDSLEHGALAGSGDTLTAKVPKLYPYHGQAHLETVVFCDGVKVTSPAFDLYIDPSGNIYDRYGMPVTDAKVTLLRAGTTDTFTPLPAGSLLMSESNRTNPVTTPADGSFHWDVVPGSYRLQVSKDGCDSQTSPVLVVPPARVGLRFKLDCGSAPPQATPVAITGTPELGSTLTAKPATFPGGSPLVSRGVAWMRDGVQVGTGESRVVVADDLGHSLTVVETIGAPAVENGLGEQLEFASFTLTSTPLAVPPGNTGQPCPSYATTFLAPVDGSTASKTVANTMKNGRVVPVKVRIHDKCALADVADPTRVITIRTSLVTSTASGTDPVETFADAGASNAGVDQFRWSSDGFWIYNLDTKALGLVSGKNYRVDVYVAGVKATSEIWAVLQPVK